jgi:tetratricopeptide (TPR) repeat protein
MELYELFSEGRRRLAAGEVRAAIPPLEQARNISPATGSIREALAVAYLRAQRYGDAPNDHYAYYLLGRAYQGVGDRTAARAQFKLANWLRPGDEAYQAALAAVA